MSKVTVAMLRSLKVGDALQLDAPFIPGLALDAAELRCTSAEPLAWRFSATYLGVHLREITASCKSVKARTVAWRVL